MKRDSSDEEAQALAHDFNNLLTAIIGATDAVLERSGLDPETRADIAHIREGVRRGALLVRRLRGDADDATLPPEIISVNETIRATYRLLDHRLGANATLALKLAESDDRVELDPPQLDRVLLNLVTNAYHAMPTGGTVTLGTARRVITTAEQLVPDTVPPGDYVVISVVDTGSGIQNDQISRIFEAGFSAWRQAGGSGLGLASTRDIVRRSDGFLSVASVKGQGTRFEIYLPRIEDALPRVEAETPPATLVRTVLLVEDDMLVRDVAEWALRRAGWTVLCADSAEGALEVLKESKCDLMISDIAMPGMDGAALARLVLARQPGLPVILTSGYQHTEADEAPGLANVVFLTKPYGQAELLTTIARIVVTGD